MARQLRIVYQGALYHITTRGNEKKIIFYNDYDCQKLYNILIEAKNKYNITVYSYIFMPNHYHLLIETEFPNLSKCMHFIQSKYSNYFNNKYKRAGHLFQGRFKAFIVDKDSYLLALVKYIHLNPVRAGLVKLPGEYRWGSFSEYLYKANLVNTDFVLGYFGRNKKNFINFNCETMNQKWDEIIGETYANAIIGDKSFTEKIKGIIEKAKLDIDIPFRTKLKKRISKEEILKNLQEYFNIPLKDLTEKKGRWNEARKIAIYLLAKFTDMPQNLMGILFGGVSANAVSRLITKMENRRKVDANLDKIISIIECRIKV